MSSNTKKKSTTQRKVAAAAASMHRHVGATSGQITWVEPLVPLSPRDVASTLTKTPSPQERALPTALADLAAAIVMIECNQSDLHDRLRRVLDPSTESEAGYGEPATTVVEPKLVEIVSNLTNRLRALGSWQRDIIDRLHV